MRTSKNEISGCDIPVDVTHCPTVPGSAKSNFEQTNPFHCTMMTALTLLGIFIFDALPAGHKPAPLLRNDADTCRNLKNMVVHATAKAPLPAGNEPISP